MKNKKKIITLSVLISIVTLSIFMIINKENTEETILSSATSLSNTKIGWGIKRNDNHEQPDLGSKNKALLDQYEGIAMGNKESKFVYLTFDEGYEAGYTDRILQTLKDNDVTATFFITAHYVNTQSELVQKMIDNGHIVGNHTVNHKSMPTLSDEQVKTEVMTLHTTLYEKFGYEMKYIRPPMGEFSERTLSLTNNLGYTTVMWSFAYDDWNEDNQKGIEYAKEKILNNVHNGAVILLHGNSSDNCNVLDYIIKEIKNMGYEFKSLDAFQK